MKTRLNTSCLGCGQTTAFTLVEMLVVIAIVALAVGAMIPALGEFLDSARVPNAQNLISVSLTNARNYAVANSIKTALLFVEDDDGNTRRTLMFLAKEDLPDNPDEFVPVPGRETTHLPDNIMVTNDPADTVAICFLASGQLTTFTINQITKPNPPGGTINDVDIDEQIGLDIYDYVGSGAPKKLAGLYINYYTGAAIEE